MTLSDVLVDGRMKHGKMHNIRRADPSQISSLSRISFTSGDGASTVATATGLSTAEHTESGFTTITQTVVESITQPATTLVSTHPQAVIVTDPTSYSSLRASESRQIAKASSTTTNISSAPAATSSAATKSSSSNNLGTLIPAIVIPLAVVLVASFALFWFIMRRRHQNQLQAEPEFVMATKREKPISRGNSNSSGTSSTRELVPMSKLEKEVAPTTTEVIRPSIDLFPPNYPSAGIGVARPMTPPDKAGVRSNPFAKEIAPSIPNFSSVRPSTSGKSRPRQDKAHGKPSQSTQSRDAPTPRAGGRTTPQGQRGPPPRVESPAMTGPRTAPGRPPRPGDPDIRPGARSWPRGFPPAVNTNMSTANRAAPPRPLNSLTPTGAFNGATSISQYSPIVKEMSSLGAVATSDDRLPQIRSSRTDSPIDGNVLSRENMRIARLANSSRLSFANSPTAETFSRGNDNNNNNNTKALLPLSGTQPRAKPDLSHALPSPELPPPLTRSDLPPKPFARGLDSPGPGSSIYPSPSIGIGNTPRLGAGPSQASFIYDTHIGLDADRPLEHRESIVSNLSSDDEYVDMELDAKSDVSSLDERERWETEMGSERLEAASRLGTGHSGGGYGSAGMSSIEGPSGGSSAGTGTTKPSGSTNLRDRDSEGPFVLSRY